MYTYNDEQTKKVVAIVVVVADKSVAVVVVDFDFSTLKK
jgi:hypothetical protein